MFPLNNSAPLSAPEEHSWLQTPVTPCESSLAQETVRLFAFHCSKEFPWVSLSVCLS